MYFFMVGVDVAVDIQFFDAFKGIFL